MTTLHVVKTMSSTLVAATDEDTNVLKRFKQGSVYRMEFSEMRNGGYFRKWWALATIAYEMHADDLPVQEYKGVKVLPDFERFRKDLTIMAGFFRPVWNAKGELRLEAESLKWSKMTEERFEKLYSASIDAILQNILPGRGLTEEKLRDWADRVLDFA